MRTKQEMLQLVADTGAVAVLRIPDPAQVMPVFEALKDGGVKCIEITMSTPNAIEVIAELAKTVPEDIALGVGTVLDPETARAAILAGAEFVVAPTTNFDVIRMCQRYDKVVMPGAFTPTEILAAWEAGADVVKVFPASLGGPGLIKAIKGPLPQITLLPTGGVTIENAAEFIRAGSIAVGIGGKLIDKQAMAEGKFEIIREKARKLVTSIAAVKR
ncbi:MAG: 2-dehydro-3-deoxyphosphogluconate aldolase [Candidatus Latescibacteria bacterium 4484_107]|nr:MAG: 2-dehydro-3-deoxyphosphogluconate aldolase [Candidatus Latescibacteria bacterium 4484_107]